MYKHQDVVTAPNLACDDLKIGDVANGPAIDLTDDVTGLDTGEIGGLSASTSTTTAPIVGVMIPSSSTIPILRMSPLTSVRGKRGASDRTNWFEDLGHHGDG